MIKTIYSRAFTVLSRKPLRLWGLSLLGSLFVAMVQVLFGLIPGVAIAINMLLSTGLVMVFLHGYLGQEVEVANLFECFKDWPTAKRVLCGTAYAALWIFLWGLIPVVGPVIAIIRAYEYALTPYILVMEPEVSIKEAYKVSEKRMDGYKAKMFWADFIWILAVWVVLLILFLLSMIKYVGAVFAVLFGLVVLCVSAFGALFCGLVNAAFYVEIQRSTGEGPQFDDSMNYPVKKYLSAPTGPSDGIVYCSRCGSANLAGGKFCSTCGSPIFSADYSEASTVNEAEVQEAVDEAPDTGSEE